MTYTVKVFEDSRIADIDVYEYTKDTKVFDSDGKRVAFKREQSIYYEYTDEKFCYEEVKQDDVEYFS